MKKIILSIVVSFGLIFNSAFADCEPMYKKHKVKAATRSALSSTGGAGTVALGAYAAAVGAIVGAFASNEGFIIVGLVAGGLTATQGITLTVKSVKNAVRFVSLFKAMRLIQESKVGSGEKLEELADDLNEEYDLSGSQAVNAKQIAHIINQGNSEKYFCVDSKNLYGKKVMVEYLTTELRL